MPDILIRVDPELKTAIKASAERRERSMSYMIRRALQRAFLSDTPPPKPKLSRRVKAAASSDGFDEFYAAYPRKVGKADALRAWMTLSPDPELVAQMTAAVTAQRTWPAWRKDGGKFIPHPATWIRGRRWEDEPPPVRTTNVDMSGLAAAAARGPQ